jgi:outer membrane lipoprotein LolB
MKLFRKAWFVIIFSLNLSLTSCMLAPPAPQIVSARNQNIAWPSRLHQLDQIKHWDMQGLIGIRTTGQAFSANWRWQQKGGFYVITLDGPLGINAFELLGTPRNVKLVTGDGQKFTAASPEKLLQEKLHLQLPVTLLFYWIRGLPAPKTPATQEFDTYHHLHFLKQAGWQIDYEGYQAIGNIDLPHRILLVNDDIKVKIIINEWHF